MNRFKKVMFGFLFVMMTACIFCPKMEVYADDTNNYYPMNCDANYEVSDINDDGSFNKIACYSDFDSAKNKMKELGGDHVVRFKDSLSPTKIVSMNSGFAYSYPGRSNSVTMNLYESATDRSIYTKRTYITNHYEMTYYGDSKDANGKRMVKVAMNGFEGYVYLDEVDLVPTKYIEEGIALYLGGNNTYEDESAFKVVPRQNYFIAEQNGNYVDLKFVSHRTYPLKNSLEPVKEIYYLGPAPAFMKMGVKYYSNDAIHYYADPALETAVGTYYSYYQFLPLRSKTNITAAQMETYLAAYSRYDESVMKNQAQIFIDAQNKYGVNALLIYAMAIHESGYGTSNYAVKRNNLFGWSAFDADPDQATYFPSIKQAVEEHMGINLRGYIDVTDGRFFNSSLGNKGSGLNVKYASDPYWGIKIAQHAYRIDKYANNHNGKLSDYNQYDLALVTEFDISVKAEPNSSSKTLYTTGYGGEYQKDFIVIRLDEVGEYTMIQSTNAIDENGNIKTHQSPPTTGKVNPISTYDFDDSIAYIKTSQLEALNYEIAIAPSGPFEYGLETIDWNDQQLSLKGHAYLPGLIVNADNTVEVTLSIFNEDQTYDFKLKTNIQNEDEVYFDDLINLTSIEEGQYNFKIQTEYSRFDSDQSFMIQNATIPSTKVMNDTLYSFALKNGLLTLNVEAYQEDDLLLLTSIDALSYDHTQMKMSGIGAIAGMNFNVLEDVSHEIIFKQIEDPTKFYSFKATTKDSNGFSLNDGSDYQYSAFEAEIDLSTLEKTAYTISLKVSNGDVSKEIYLLTNNRNYSLKTVLNDGYTYKLSTNEIYGYRLEFDIFKSDLKYADIKKPSTRASLVSFDTIDFNEEGLLTIDYYAMMYYLDYNSKTNPKYNFYFVNENGESFKADQVEKVACAVNFKDLLGSSNDLTDICYKMTTDVTKLEEGNYTTILTIENGDYFDIIELTNRSNRTIESLDLNKTNYSFKTSLYNSRLELNIVEE